MAVCTLATTAASLARRAPCSAVLPKRLASRACVRAAPRRPMAAAAAPSAAGAASQLGNMVPFSRPGSASQSPLTSLDDQVPTVFVEPPPTGRRSQPRFVRSAPVAYGACTGDAWRAAATYVDVNAGVADCFAGLNTAEWHQVAYDHLSDATNALDAAAASLSPPTAGRTLRHLAAEAGTALALVAPGGTSALAALPSCQLSQLFQRAAACASELVSAGSPAVAIDTALAALQLLSHLRFGSAAAAEPYAAAACALKAALAAAARSPAAAISERQVLCLISACARAGLWLTPWVCQRWSAATEACLTAGWSSGEAAVQYLESWCALVARGRLHFAPAKFQAAAEAAVGHELTTAQLGRLLAAEAALPAHLTTTVNAWLAGWTATVSARRAALVRAQAKAAAGTAVRARRAAAHSAAAAVELTQAAPALLAFA